MKTPYFKPLLLISLFSAFIFTACQKGDLKSNDSDSTASKGNNSNTSNNITATIPFSATPYTVSTFAGSHQSGTVDGTGTAAGFQSPRALAMDASGNLFVSDPLINEIRKITTPGAVVTTIATSSNLNSVTAAMAVDANDNLYISETSPYKVTQGGIISPMNLGFPNAHGLAADGSGNIYVSTNSVIYKTTAAGGSATIFAGNSTTTAVTDGTGTAASFNSINSLATDASGNLYATDLKSGTPVIRKITPAGVVTTITLTPVAPTANTANTNYTNGPIIGGLAIDGSGNFYATDTGSNRILKITSGGAVTVIAGTVTAGQANGAGTGATFNLPMGIAVNTAGNIIYVADAEGQVIRKIVPTP
jgi:sugar lactone lactonase YvrE